MSSDPSPAAGLLARRLHELRVSRWPGQRVTQRTVAQALGDLSTSTISSYENGSITPPNDRLLGYATFFASVRSLSTDPPSLLPDTELTDAERVERKALFEELLALRPDDPGSAAASGVAGASRRTWHFADGSPVRLVCGDLPEEMRPSLADLRDVNYTELLSYTDLDAMVELFGHVRMENPASDVRFRRSGHLVTLTADDVSGHIVLLGSLGWNQATKWVAFREDLPVRQLSDPKVQDGEVFEVSQDGNARRFYPTFDESLGLVEDIGLLYRMPNPNNLARTLTICSGVFSRGVLGAVRCLTDARLRARNEAYLAQRFADADEFGIIMRVPVLGGSAVTPELTNPDVRLFEYPETPRL